MLNQPEQIPKDASEKSALGENQVEILVHKPSAELDDDVRRGDGQKEKCGNGGADDSADGFKGIEPVFDCHGGQGDGDGQTENNCRVAERKKETDGDRPFALLHQFARHIVNRRDVVGIHRVTKAECVGQQRRAQQNRIIVKSDQRPNPAPGIGRDEQRIHRNNPALQVARRFHRRLAVNLHDSILRR